MMYYILSTFAYLVVTRWTKKLDCLGRLRTYSYSRFYVPRQTPRRTKNTSPRFHVEVS